MPKHIEKTMSISTMYINQCKLAPSDLSYAHINILHARKSAHAKILNLSSPDNIALPSFP